MAVRCLNECAEMCHQCDTCGDCGKVFPMSDLIYYGWGLPQCLKYDAEED